MFETPNWGLEIATHKKEPQSNLGFGSQVFKEGKWKERKLTLVGKLNCPEIKKPQFLPPPQLLT